MRDILALAALTVTAVLAAVPARAQTYDPNYPVCLQFYSIGGGTIECAYTSLAQCAQSTRGGQCIINPFFAGAPAPARSRYWR